MKCNILRKIIIKVISWTHNKRGEGLLVLFLQKEWCYYFNSEKLIFAVHELAASVLSRSKYLDRLPNDPPHRIPVCWSSFKTKFEILIASMDLISVLAHEAWFFGSLILFLVAIIADIYPPRGLSYVHIVWREVSFFTPFSLSFLSSLLACIASGSVCGMSLITGFPALCYAPLLLLDILAWNK